MAVSDAKRLQTLEEENRRLKQLLAETMLDNQAASSGDRPTGAWALPSSCLQADRHFALGGRASTQA